jgi:hypothetical protein
MSGLDYSPSGTFPTFPLTLVLDGEVVNHDSTFKSTDPKKGLFAKLIDAVGWLKDQIGPSSPVACTRSQPLHIVGTTFVSADGTDPDAWMTHTAGSAGAAVQTRPVAATGDSTLLALDRFVDGATLTSVKVTTKGTSGTSSVNLPTYKIVRWKKEAAPADMSASTTDGHTGANWTSADVETTITVNALSTIDASYSYGLLVNHPYEASFNGAVKIKGIELAFTVPALVLAP